MLRGMEHWSEACWSEAWGFGPRHGPFGPRHVWSEAWAVWSEARSGNGPRDRLGVTVRYKYMLRATELDAAAQDRIGRQDRTGVRKGTKREERT